MIRIGKTWMVMPLFCMLFACGEPAESKQFHQQPMQGDHRTDVPLSAQQELSCSEIVECALSSCGVDFGCYRDCIEQGDAEAQQLANDLLECAAWHRCSDMSCVYNYCGDEMEACEQDTLPADCDPPCAPDEVCEDGQCLPAPQELSCSEIVECAVPSCGVDFGCYRDCIEQGDAEAQQLANDLLDCIVRHICSDMSCVYNYCGDEMEACEQDTLPPG